MVRIAIFDYGIGNIGSIQNSLSRLSVQSYLTEDLNQESFDAIILPGVGSFDTAMKRIDSLGARSQLSNLSNLQIPILGICLGMHILFEKSEEGCELGLSLIPGKIARIAPNRAIQKVPHIGYNTLEITGQHPLLKNTKTNDPFYFVHSYACMPAEKKYCLAQINGTKYSAVVQNKLIFGFQFHPEKSGVHGLNLLRNFLSVVIENGK